MSQDPIPWGLGPPPVVLGPLLKQTLGWITALLHPSSVHHLLLTYVLVPCIGFIHVVKSRPCSSISSWGLTLLTASASATSLPGMYLISKLHSCIVSYILCWLDGATRKKLLFWRLIVSFAYKPFCHISSSGISILTHNIKHFFLNNGIPHFGRLTIL